MTLSGGLDDVSEAGDRVRDEWLLSEAGRFLLAGRGSECEAEAGVGSADGIAPIDMGEAVVRNDDSPRIMPLKL